MKLDAHFNKAFNEFNKQDDLRFDQYVEHKLRAWFSFSQPCGSQQQLPTTTPRGAPGSLRAWRPGGGAGVAGEEEEEEEAYALSGGE